MVEQRTAHYQYDLDVLRTLACFLVVWQHVTECYYILPDFNIWHYKIFCVNGNTGFRNESRIFYFIHLQNEEDYERKESSSA